MKEPFELTVLKEDCVGHTRAVALDSDGTAVALFLDRWADHGVRVLVGEVYSGRLKRLAPEQGGGFVQLNDGPQVFVRTKSLAGLAEGAAVNVTINAEARRDKLARASVTNDNPTLVDPFQRWLESFPSAAGLATKNVPAGNETIAAAFEEALSDAVTIPGGGRLQIAETPALVAIDIDTAGRRDAGRAYDRAQRVNLLATREAARHVSLRGLGGPIVIDCVSPLRRATQSQIKDVFLTSFRAFSARKAEALAPSPFGLMECVIAWGQAPISHLMTMRTGEFTSLSRLLHACREVEKVLILQRAHEFELALPEGLHSRHGKEIGDYSQAFQNRYGARLSIGLSESDSFEVVRR